MANITRKHYKLFANAATNNGQFGSSQAGTKIESNDPDIIQALAAYDNGWLDATSGATKLPPLEEMQGLQYNNSRQIYYLTQKGIPEYNASLDYHIGDITREIGGSKVYESITNNNEGNALTDVANWQLLGDLANLINTQQATTTALGTTLLPKPITIANNSTDSDHDIDFGAGVMNFDDGSGQAATSALTKQFDATFALGDDAGGMVSGESLPTDGLVYMFAISTADGTLTDIIGTTTRDGSTISGDSVVSTNSLTKKQYIGAFYTDASNNILAGQYFVNKSGYRFQYKGYIFVDNSSSISRKAINMRVPPNAKVDFLAQSGGNSSTICFTLYTNLNDFNINPQNNYCSQGTNINFGGYSQLSETANENGEIGKRNNNLLTAFNSTRTKGWEEKY